MKKKKGGGIFGKNHQIDLQKAFLSKIDENSMKTYNYVMKFPDSTTNFDLVPSSFSNNSILPYIELTTSDVVDYNNLPSIDDFIDLLTYLPSAKDTFEDGSTDDKTEESRLWKSTQPSIKYVLKNAMRERNSVKLIYGNIVYYEHNTDENKYEEESKNRRFCSALILLITNIVEDNPSVTSLQIFMILSLIPYTDEYSTIFVNSIKQGINEEVERLSTNVHKPNPMVLASKCQEPFPHGIQYLDKSTKFWNTLHKNNKKLTQSLCESSDETIVDYIKSFTTISITKNLKIKKNTVCFLSYLTTDNNDLSSILLCVGVNKLYADIKHDKLTLVTKFRWTVDTEDLTNILSMVDKTNYKKAVSFLYDITPISKESSLSFDYTCKLPDTSAAETDDETSSANSQLDNETSSENSELVVNIDKDIDNEINSLISELETINKNLCDSYCFKRKDNSWYKSKQSCIKNNCTNLVSFLTGIKDFIKERVVSYDGDNNLFRKINEILHILPLNNEKTINNLNKYEKEKIKSNLNEIKNLLTSFTKDKYALVVKTRRKKMGIRKQFWRYGGTRKSSKRRRSRKALKYCNKYLTRKK